ncbi:MAG: Gfo/Idh/MocA family protein [Lactovum sp.]
MLKLAVIGTSMICQQFIEATLKTGDYNLKALYSRSKEKASDFLGELSQVEVFDDLESFVQYDEIDVVYIASPNSLHYYQAKAALNAGKHIIVEKPAFSNPREFSEISNLAKEKGLYVLEAARHIHDQAFKVVKDFLSDKKILGATLTYAKYSSKMPALLAGELPNKWNPKFSGGILSDLGVYLVYWSLGQFGQPEQVDYSAQILESGVDVSGIGILRYPTFDVNFFVAGNLNSYLPSEVYTEKGTLILDSVAGTTCAEFVSINGEKESLEIFPSAQLLFDEAKVFAQVIENREEESYENYIQLAKSVNQYLYDMRKKVEVQFEADEDKLFL